MKYYNAEETAEALPFPQLVESLRETICDYDAGRIRCPERMSVFAPDRTGLLMAMPVASREIMVTKVLTICPDNRALYLPAIQGQVICADASDGQILFSLDGPIVTRRRTAAVTMLGIGLLASKKPEHVLIIGTGIQAEAHCEALNSIFPDVCISVLGRSARSSEIFCKRQKKLQDNVVPWTQSDHPDVVIAVTSSREILYDATPDPDCLIVGVGAYRPDMIEFGPRLVNGSELYVDDIVGAASEAGDFIQAGVDWKRVSPLAAALTTPPAPGRPVFFKSVGCAAWDLAACRVVRSEFL